MQFFLNAVFLIQKQVITKPVVIAVQLSLIHISAATIKKVECKEKSEKPPALYDLTTLQRDANRLLGFTAQQTLDLSLIHI